MCNFVLCGNLKNILHFWKQISEMVFKMYEHFEKSRTFWKSRIFLKKSSKQNLENVWNKSQKKNLNIFENLDFVWKNLRKGKNRNCWNFSQNRKINFVFMTQIFVIETSRTFCFECSFISKTYFWILKTWDLRCRHYRKKFMILTVCRTFLPEFSTDFICMSYLNVARRFTHEWLMQIKSGEKSRRKVQTKYQHIGPKNVPYRHHNHHTDIIIINLLTLLSNKKLLSSFYTHIYFLIGNFNIARPS